MAHPLTHLTHGIPTRRPFHPAKWREKITRKTRSRRLAVAPLHHGAPRCDGCATLRTTMKASPHRHNWLLSRGSPADPSDPWNSHAAPVSPRQNGQVHSYRLSASFVDRILRGATTV